MKRNIFFGICVLFSLSCFAQEESFYLGGGYSNGIAVSTSDDKKLYEGTFVASGQNTINGNGLDAKRIASARFLAQCTFGANRDLIDQVAQQDFEEWIDDQMKIEPHYLSESVMEVYHDIFETYIAEGGDSISFPNRPHSRMLDYAWWDNTIQGEDLLRQRMAYALSEILVISLESQLVNYGQAVAVYYDILTRNAYGNFRDILNEVTHNVAMGWYLSHLNNAKANPAENTFPDENYAREIMQLFSIGLYELNQDGSRKTDAYGNYIPTYNNEDIKEFAKVFTGFGIGARRDTAEVSFGNSIYISDVTVPMKMYDEYHDSGEKHLLNGFVIPAGQTGEEDIADAIDHLFNHENVGPFICTHLIQHFVKSNPTPSYISEVTAVFNNNGSGVRGDLGAVLKAVLLHPEARSCEWMNDFSQGKLREPVIRYTTVARHFGGTSPYKGKFWNVSYNLINDLDQHPLHAPTVFNFYSPDFSPSGEISEAGMVAPEFQIHNSRTGINYSNWIYYWVEYEYLMAYSSADVPEGTNTVITTNLTDLYEFAKDADAIIDRLDAFLCHGQLSEHTRKVIKETIEKYPLTTSGLTSRVELAAYLILISPDYTILK